MKRDGLFFCSTFGTNGMMQYLYRALDELGIPYDHESNISFTLQNGMQLLEKQFDRVERRDYEDALEITDVEDYLEYIYSMASLQGLDRGNYDILLKYFNSRKRNGCLHVPKGVWDVCGRIVILHHYLLRFHSSCPPYSAVAV